MRIEPWIHGTDSLHGVDFVTVARTDRVHKEYAPEWTAVRVRDRSVLRPVQ